MLPFSLPVCLALVSLVVATPQPIHRRANSTSDEIGLLSNASDLGSYADAYAKAQSFVAGLSTADKISLITGSDVTSANWTGLAFKDGSEGVQQYDYVSAFSDMGAMTMTWNKTAMYAQCNAAGKEFYLDGFQVVSGPVTSPLGRTQWDGRLAETLGADSYLAGIALGQGVQGFQDAGVILGGRHFLLNEQETNRSASMSGGGGGGGFGGGSEANSSSSSTPSLLVATSSTAVSSASATASSDAGSAPYSSNADDKTAHETYLWPFYDGVKAGMGAVMCAMNKVNTTLSCENNDLLMKMLKTQLSFPGVVYPDVNGQSTAFGSANGGLDYGSSSIWSSSTMEAGLANGTLTEARLDDMAIRNVIGWYYVGLDDGAQPSEASAGEVRISKDIRAQHAQLIRQTAAQSLVLLKNTNNTLPLTDPGVLSIFGAHAGPVMGGPNQGFSVTGSGPTLQGHMSTGSGGGAGSLPYLITPQMALTNRAAEDGTMISWILNDTYTSASSGFGSIPGIMTGTSISPSIAGYAETADTAIVFLNALAGEGADRTELTNADQDALVLSVASECSNTIVVINTIAARLVDQWIDNVNVTAVLYGGPLGQQSGNSIVDVLYGDVNPSGKLTYTIAKNESDYNVKICETAQCDFTEGNYIDYKYFDSYNVTPRYEFGYGLSYTTFEYGDAAVALNQTIASGLASGTMSPGGRQDLWDELVTVSVAITNSGSVDGAEVAQLYLGYPDEADQPVRQLRGFEKLSLTSGETGTASFSLRRRDLSFWDVSAQEWSVAAGTYTVYVGSSSRDLRSQATFDV